MIVREAELWDVPALFDLAERFHAEANPGFPLPEPLAIHQTIAETKATPGLCCFVAEDGAVSGFITGSYSRFPHSFKNASGFTMFYVDPRNRGGAAAKMLLRQFIRWSISKNAFVVCGGIVSGIKEERFGKFLERAGFNRVGVSYMRFL